MEKRDKLTFVKMGGTITDKDYVGDIGNHRVRAFFEDNGVMFIIEVTSTYLERTMNKITGLPLKKRIRTSESNGCRIEIITTFEEPIRGCTGRWFLHSEEKTIAECMNHENNNDEHDFLHNWSFVRWYIVNHTGIMFDVITFEE
jgi:hypothetical protein